MIGCFSSISTFPSWRRRPSFRSFRILWDSLGFIGILGVSPPLAVNLLQSFTGKRAVSACSRTEAPGLTRIRQDSSGFTRIHQDSLGWFHTSCEDFCPPKTGSFLVCLLVFSVLNSLGCFELMSGILQDPILFHSGRDLLELSENSTRAVKKKLKHIE